MRIQLSKLLFITMFSSLAACGGSGGGTIASSSAPIPPPAGGTGGATGSASLTWVLPTENSDGSTLVDLSGFRIYQGSSSDTATHSLLTSLTNPSISTFLVENLSPGTYFFTVTAMNSQNTESDFSNAAQITIN